MMRLKRRLTYIRRIIWIKVRRIRILLGWKDRSKKMRLINNKINRKFDVARKVDSKIDGG